MKTIKVLTMVLAGAALAVAPLRAEEPAKEMKCCCKKEDDAKKQEMEKKMQAMEAKMKAEAAEFDKLLDEMNASTGDKKIEAMAAIINKMAQKHKEMHAKMGGMMMMGMMKKDGKPGANPAAKPEGKAGEVDYYTCKMHPAVHWPVPGKCPICSMDLVPVVKNAAAGKPEGKPEAKPGEETKKADDPHAGHH